MAIPVGRHKISLILTKPMEKFFSFLRVFFGIWGDLPLLFRLWGPGRTNTCTHLLSVAMVQCQWVGPGATGVEEAN